MHAVVFDIDGTLVNSCDVDDRLYWASVQAVLGDVQIHSDIGDYRHVTDTGILLQVLAENSMATNADTIRLVQRRFLRSFESYFQENEPFAEIPGAKAFLGRLVLSQNHAVALATGGWQKTARLKLKSSGFDIDDIPLASSDDAVERTEIMRKALAKLGDDFDSIMYFGDGHWERAECKCLGWKFQPVGRGLGGIVSYEDLASCGLVAAL